MVLWKGILCLFLPIFLVCGKEVEINVLYTADVHGNLFCEGLIYGDISRTNGGLLRCKQLVTQIRASMKNVLMVDCGDIFQGGPESFLTQGKAVANAFNKMQYDAFVLGNHEFDWGQVLFWKICRELNVPLLAADVAQLSEKATSIKIRPFLVKDFDGVRLVLVGLSNPNIPNWFDSTTLQGLKFDDPLIALKKIFPTIRKLQPAIIILAVHQGYRAWGDDQANRIYAIASRYPEIDVIIGAHTHDAVEAEEVNGVLYTQAGPYGRNLGHVSLSYDVTQKRLIKRHAELWPVNENTAKISDALSDEDRRILERTERYLGEEICTMACTQTADEVTPGQSRVQSLIACAIAEESGADIVLQGVLSTASLFAGEVYMRDVWRIVPYDNTIWLVELTLAEIKEILAENAQYLGTRQFRGVYGITYTIAFENGTASIKDILIDGNQVRQATQRFKTAVSSFDIASAGGRFPRLRAICSRESSCARNTGRLVRDTVTDFIRRHPDFNLLLTPPKAGAILAEKQTLLHRKP